MKIPDLLSPIVAYRTWGWDALGITSLNDTRWVPGEAMKARCSRFEDLLGMLESNPNTTTNGWEKNPHEVPNPTCSCGVYAAKNFQHLVDIGYAEHGIHGEVSLWGTVMEHRLGYRAQYAYPKTFVIPESMVPYPAGAMTTQLEGLMLFGVPIFIRFRGGEHVTSDDGGVYTERIVQEGPRDVLFWDKNQGVSSEAVANLLEYRARWYTYKILNSKLKDGDRVSLRGKGIGIAHAVPLSSLMELDKSRSGMEITTSTVQVVLWNNTSYFLKREDIAWNEGNNRWEASQFSQFWERSAYPKPRAAR